MARLSLVIERNIGTIRTLLYGGIVTTLGTTLVYAWSKGDISLRFVGGWFASLCGIALIGEYIILRAKHSRGRVLLASDQDSLISLTTMSIAQHLSHAKKRLDLLGRTFKSFADGDDKLRVLGRDLELRVLIVHPIGPGPEQIARARRELKTTNRDQDLVDEILTSLGKLIRAVGGAERAEQVLRLYQSPSGYSDYRIDDMHIITVYGSGHGKSSPTVLVRREAGCDDFCEAFEKTFEVIWNAQSTVRLSESNEVMKQLEARQK